MNCKKCGSPLSENDQFCKNCGAPVNAQNEQSGVQQPMNNSMNPMNQQAYQQPQQNYNQPAWANGYNPNPNYQPQKPNGNLKYVIIGVVIVVAIFAVVIGIFMFNSKDNNEYSGGLTGGSGITNTSNKTYKVNFKGFTFSIPDNLVYEERNDMLYVGDEEGTWLTQLELEQGSFAQLKSNKSQLASVMQQNGYTCSAAAEKTLGGVEFITMEIAYGGENAIAALAKANSMYFIGITAYNQDNDIDYKLLEKIAPIINSAEQTSVSNSIAPNNSFDFSAFSDLAK